MEFSFLLIYIFLPLLQKRIAWVLSTLTVIRHQAERNFWWWDIAKVAYLRFWGTGNTQVSCANLNKTMDVLHIINKTCNYVSNIRRPASSQIRQNRFLYSLSLTLT